ncbi:hypothetical protein BDR26DRAFT_872000 [Obelidium mucronatum]|nr:hypothetical protein BDR26DRAFT_872000 [Obelidium mucronatum]
MSADLPAKWGCASLTAVLALCDTPMCDKKGEGGLPCPGMPNMFCVHLKLPKPACSSGPWAAFNDLPTATSLPVVVPTAVVPVTASGGGGSNENPPDANVQQPALTVTVLVNGAVSVIPAAVSASGMVPTNGALSSPTQGVGQVQQQQDPSSTTDNHGSLGTLVIAAIVIGSIIALLLAGFLFVKLRQKPPQVIQVSSLVTRTENSKHSGNQGYIEIDESNNERAAYVEARPQTLSNGDIIMVPMNKRLYRDDYFDDDVTSVDVNSTYISVKENEIRPFDPTGLASPIDTPFVPLPIISPTDKEETYEQQRE